MEPTIYKPSIYNGAGVYKIGAGGIYNGRGVYKDGKGQASGFFYEFHLSRFDLNTLKDGDVQWYCNAPNYLSKESDCLAINLSSTFKFYFRPDIDKTKKIIAEFTINLPTIDYQYAGFGCFIDGGTDYNFMLYAIGANYWFANSALAGTIQNSQIYNGGRYNGSWSYNSRFDSFPYTTKQKIKLELNPDGHGKFYIDEILSIDGDFTYDYEYFLNNFKFFIYSESSSGTIRLYSLKIWQE